MIIENHAKEILKPGGKCCGNCKYHSAYQYPDTIFCFDKFGKNESPVKSIFDACNEWEFKEQACFCLDEALKYDADAEAREFKPIFEPTLCAIKQTISIGRCSKPRI